jgi:hypothetical protein
VHDAWGAGPDVYVDDGDGGGSLADDATDAGSLLGAGDTSDGWGE